jgi:hypothetical protein
LGPSARLSDFPCGGRWRLSHLPLESYLAIPFSRARLCHGMAGHGLARHVCDHWRCAAERSPGHGLHRSVDAEENSDGDFATHRRSDDGGSRSAKRHSSGAPGHNHTCGCCGRAALHRPAANGRPQCGEYERRMGLLSSNAEAAAGLRYRDSNMRRDGGHFCGALRDQRQRRHDSKIRRASGHSIDDGHSHLCALGKNCCSRWAETVRDCDVLLFLPFTQSRSSPRAASEDWFLPSSSEACGRSASRPGKP